MGWLIFDGISLLYVFTLVLLSFIIMGIFAQRQIVRLRNNSARNKPNVSLRSSLSKRSCAEIDQQLQNVTRLRESYLPRLTDCTTIAEHSHAPYVHRMIAVDEITLLIDMQLERIDLVGLARQPAETTLAYLTRIQKLLPTIPTTLIHRITFLHESARYRNQKFEIEHLMELRSLLNQFVKIVNDGHGTLTAAQPTPSKGFSFLNISTNRRRRSKFGGSDGGRLLAAGSGGVSSTPSSREERIALLPMTTSDVDRDRSLSPTSRLLRRKSDTRLDD